MPRIAEVAVGGLGRELTQTFGDARIFGERALLGDDIERTARVRAETDVRCLAISRPEIERLLADDPRFAERLRQLSP